jgi:lipoprotein NlpI
MRIPALLRATALLLMAGRHLVSPAAADDLTTCRDARGDAAITACTRAINSGGWRGAELAAAYASRCHAYDEKGDSTRAIADCSEAIRANPHYDYVYMVYADRGDAYRAKGDLSHAISDYTEAIRLEPNYPQSYNGRGRAYEINGELDRAISDYGMAINLKHEYAPAYAGRGRAYLYRGNPAKALADLTQASELDPKSVEDALWVDIVRQRSNLPSRLAEAAGKIDMKTWPAPVIRMFLGQMSPAAVFLAADDPDADMKKDQTCVANFYTAELALRTGGKAEAMRLFRLAQSGCPHDITWSAANAELKALGGGH